MLRVRSLLLATLISTIASAPAAAQAPVDLPRIGTSLDAYEQSYFGLFPEVLDFQVGRFEQQGDSLVAIAERISGETRVALDATQAALLREYLTHYEDTARLLERDIASLGVLVRYVVRTQPGQRVVMQQRNGRIITGQLVAVDDRYIAIYEGAQPFAVALSDVPTLYLAPLGDVATIQTAGRGATSLTRRAVLNGGAALANTLIGGANIVRTDASIVALAPIVTNYVFFAVSTAASNPAGDGLSVPTDPAMRSDFVEQLRSAAVFWTGAPPEVEAEAVARLGIAQASSPELAAAAGGEVAPPALRTKRVHLVAGGVHLFDTTPDIEGTYATGTGRDPLGTVVGVPASFLGEALFSTGMPRLRVGGQVLFAPVLDDPDLSASVGGLGALGVVEFVLRPHAVRPDGSRSPYQTSVAVGAGWAQTSLRLDRLFSTLFDTFDPSLRSDPVRTVSASGLSLYGRLSVERELSSIASLYLSAAYRQAPEATLTGEIYTYELGAGSGELFRYEDISARLPRLELMLGTRWKL